MTPYKSRSILASEYYGKHVFEEKTFADLATVGGPTIYINATDLTAANRFTFDQSQFDLICSDLARSPSPRRRRPPLPCRGCCRPSHSRITPAPAAMSFPTT
jgi:hypothetical protein